MTLGTALLLWGSLLLLALAPFGGYVVLACLALWFVVLLYGIAWYFVWTGVFAPRGTPTLDLGRDARAMPFVLAGSCVGLLSGLMILPALFPGVGWYGSGWDVVLVYGLFLFLPTVYAPVLAGHAAICLLSVRHARSDRAAHLLAAGGAYLVAIAAAGLGMESAALSSTAYLPFFWYIPGLAAPGYLLILAGWRNEAAVLARMHDISPRNEPDRPT